jgi:cytochrome c1
MAAAALVASVVGVLFLGAIRRNGAGDSTVRPHPAGQPIRHRGRRDAARGRAAGRVPGGLGVLHRMSTTTSLPEVTFELTGHQWWWDVEYLDPVIARRFHAANEIHVPVGRVVHLRLVSADVIHSFWVPSLQGKLDLVPGDTNDMRFVASEPGSWRGQCAEYCGAQHAHMAFTVVAEDDASFQHWLADQQAPAIQSSDSLSTIGRALVVTGPCALCHTVRGTMARGQVAPDLTHVGSRTHAGRRSPAESARYHGSVGGQPAVAQARGADAHDDAIQCVRIACHCHLPGRPAMKSPDHLTFAPPDGRRWPARLH